MPELTNQLADALEANDRLTRTIARLRDDLSKPVTPGVLASMRAACDVALEDAAPRPPHAPATEADILGWLDDISVSAADVALVATTAENVAMNNLRAAAALLAGASAVLRTRSHTASVGGVIENLSILAANMAERIQAEAWEEAQREAEQNEREAA